MIEDIHDYCHPGHGDNDHHLAQKSSEQPDNDEEV